MMGLMVTGTAVDVAAEEVEMSTLPAIEDIKAEVVSAKSRFSNWPASQYIGWHSELLARTVPAR